MKKNEEYLVWQETQNLMENKFVNIDSSFLDTLISTDHPLIEILSKYKFASKMIPSNSDILEISCRKGFGSPILGEMAKNYIGFDENPHFISLAKKAYIQNNFKFISEIKFDKFFDVIVDLNSYKALDDKTLFDIKLTQELLKKDGIFLFGIPNKLLNKKNDINHLQDHIQSHAQKYFNFILKFYSHNHFINSGFSIKADYLFLICFEQI